MFLIDYNSFIIFLPEWFFIFSILIGLLFGIFVQKSLLKQYLDLIFFYLLLIVLLFFMVKLNSPVFFFNLFSTNLFHLNYYIYCVQLILIFFFFIYALVIYNEIILEKFRYEFFFLLIISLLGMDLMLASNNFISFYLCLELQSLSLYILIAFKFNSFSSTEASLKYFTLSAFSTGLLLYGIIELYGFFGSFSFEEIYLLNNFYQEINYTSFPAMAILSFLFGIFFKLGAAPVQMWVADVYDGAPTVTTGFLAYLPKLAMIAFLIELFMEYHIYRIIGEGFFIQNFFLFFSLISVFYGAIAALSQVKLKKLIAYSGVSHIGFVLLGLSVVFLDGFISVFFYMFIYGLLSLHFFSILFSLRYNSGNKVKSILNLRALLPLNFVLCVSFIFLLFSMAGMPPFIGFFSKLFILQYANIGLTSLNLTFLIFIVFFLASAISAFYYVRIINFIFFSFNKNVILLKSVHFLLSNLIALFTLLQIILVFNLDLLWGFFEGIIISIF